MAYQYILVETLDRVGLVRINRPEQRNALSVEVMTEIAGALEMFDGDDGIGCMVLTGDARAFAAGSDIRQMVDATPVDVLRRNSIAPFERLRRIGKPVIAAVSGWALGGGLELAMTCDMIVASDTATFGHPEINIGIIPGAGGTQRLPRLVGKAIAMEMLLNARFLNAQEAYQFGLVNRVAAADDYLDEALALAQEIAARAPLAVRLAKESVNVAFETSLAEGMALERRNFYFLFATQDQREGMQAFIDKRDPEWRGE